MGGRVKVHTEDRQFVVPIYLDGLDTHICNFILIANLK